MPTAEDFKKHYLEMQAKLKKDIRPMIARSGQYNPENDVSYEYQHYPRWIDIPGKAERVVVKSEDEEKALLGITDKPAKAVDVDITNLAQQTEVHVKRKYTKKAAPVALPADLK